MADLLIDGEPADLKLRFIDIWYLSCISNLEDDLSSPLNKTVRRFNFDDVLKIGLYLNLEKLYFKYDLLVASNTKIISPKDYFSIILLLYHNIWRLGFDHS